MKFLQRGLIALALSMALTAHAQVADDSRMDTEAANDTSADNEATNIEAQAQGLYERGVAQLESGEDEAALASFRRAFELNTEGRYALALAATLQHRGLLTEAVALYGRLLASDLGPLQDGQAEAIVAAREAARSQQATLEVTSAHARELRVELDGSPIGTIEAGAPLALRVDPGRHFVVAVDPVSGRRGEPTSVEVREGGHSELTLRAPVDLSVRSEPPATIPAEEAASAGPRRWPWIVAAAVVVAAVVVGAVALTRDSQTGYEAAPFPNVEGLRQR